MSKLRVLHAIASIEPSYGGPVAVLKGLSRGLEKKGVSLTLLTCTSGVAAKDKENAAGLGYSQVLWSKPLLKRYYWRPFIGPGVLAHVKRHDLLHVHGVFNGLVSAACAAARKNKTPYMLSPFGTLSDYCLRKNALMKKASLSLKEKKNIERASSVQFASQMEMENAAARFRLGHAFVVPNGIDWDEFSPLRATGDVRKKYGIHPDQRLLVFLGRLQPIKGLDVFIPAFAEWKKKQRRRWGFLIVGPDERGYRRKLEEVIRRHGCRRDVFFSGPLYGKERLATLVEGDIAVLPSYHENFGIAAAEAMACNKPVLVSDQVALWPEVKRLDAGEVLAPITEAFLRALDRLGSKEGEWESMGSRGRAWAQQNCRWDKIADTVLEEYQRMARR